MAEPAATGRTSGRLTDRLGLATVRGQTTLIATVVVAMALAVSSIVLVATLNSRLTDSIATAAQTQADELAAEVEAAGPQAVQLVPNDDRLVQILDGSGVAVRSSSTQVDTVGLPYVEPGQVREIEVAFDDDGYLEVAASANGTGSGAEGGYTVLVAHALDTVAESAEALKTLLAIGVPLLLVVLAIVIWRVVGRALAPVEAIRREVEAVSATELHRRVPQSGVADEIGRLASTMNRMLARLEEARARQQQFVADASHELRSPVASIRAHAEIAMSHPEQASTAELAEDVLAEVARLQHLIEDLLVLARLDEQGSVAGREGLDLDDLVFGEVDRLRSGSVVTFDVSGVSAGRVHGDAALLRRVVANLLENARRHARSHVIVALHETPTEVQLRIEDDGAGIPVEQRDEVFRRFSRLDDARARDAGGAGLGLAIVAGVVAGHGGTVRLTESPSGGASFEVRLPRMTD